MNLDNRHFAVIVVLVVMLAIVGVVSSGGGTSVSDHGLLTGLTDDDHTQYALLDGRSGGQTLIGGTASGEDVILQSNTSDDGSVFFSGYDCSGLGNGGALTATSTGEVICTTDDGGAGGSGDNVLVNGAGVTDLDFLDGDIDFTLNTGPSPDEVTATVGCAGCVDSTDILDDGVNTADLDDGADTPAAGEFVRVATATTDFEYLPIVDADVPDTITISLAAAATALAADPGACPANQFVTDVDVSVNLTCAQPDHGNLAGLTDDDHSQYALLLGRSGGQTLIGGTGVGDDLTFQTTSNASKGSYIFSELDCTGNANGGALTATSTGAIVCTDDDGGAAGGGDVTDVFDCATGDCASITVSDGDLLDFSAVNSSVIHLFPH